MGLIIGKFVWHIFVNNIKMDYVHYELHKIGTVTLALLISSIQLQGNKLFPPRIFASQICSYG